MNGASNKDILGIGAANRYRLVLFSVVFRQSGSGQHGFQKGVKHIYPASTRRARSHIHIARVFSHFSTNRKLVDLLLGVLGRSRVGHRGRRPGTNLLVHESVQPLTLAVAVLHLLALGALLVRLLLAAPAEAPAAVRDCVLEAAVPVDDLERTGRVLFAGQLRHHLPEDATLSEG